MVHCTVSFMVVHKVNVSDLYFNIFKMYVVEDVIKEHI